MKNRILCLAFVFSLGGDASFKLPSIDPRGFEFIDGQRSFVLFDDCEFCANLLELSK